MTPEKAVEYAKQALLRAMEDYSEETWCAGWMCGLELDLWNEVVAGQHPQIKELSDDAGGWWIWCREHGRDFVPMADWLQMVESGWKPSYMKRGDQ